MYKSKILFISLFILLSININGQEIDSAKIKAVEFFKGILYQTNSNLFKKEKLYSKLEEDFSFPWDKLNLPDEKLNTALDSMIENATLSFSENDFMGNGLEFNSYFPQFIESGMLDLYDMKIIDSELRDKNNNQIKIDEKGSVNFGSKFKAGYRDGSSYSYNWVTVSATFRFEEKELDSARGKVTFKALVTSGYQYKKITRSDVGKTLSIDSLSFKVIDMFDNKVVLNFKNKDKTIFNNLEFINIDDKGNRIKQIPYFEFIKLKKEDKSIKSGPTGEGKITTYAFNYNLFKDNPDMTPDEFDAKVNDKILRIFAAENQEKQGKEEFGEKYLVIYAADNIQNFYLYFPEQIEREFSMEVK
ncbi:hypothetical protein OO013_16485 [Mangrovivirga sp. M17]|uniref:Uncharacterized protein n=1 Tax=Mangrovivirga halotolerans TaxID=2993936 RepID=A0ABT3RVU0_9BACT|nr:hypothetical protein [Mangrovivirga halotolerans]MCX2745479.1 hypothetical protein [Mangrovivirga halotolerans]